ncbi:MAG: hypothetical protein NC453_23410 [Muribaculum sp.]|nr:hypothetical protein [Muribaculum sp.]
MARQNDALVANNVTRVSSQMPYPAAVGFEFFLWKLRYRFVKFPEDNCLVIGQRSGDKAEYWDICCPIRLALIFKRSMRVCISIIHKKKYRLKSYRSSNLVRLKERLKGSS